METEKILDDLDLIVSSTDKKGMIIYVNSTFCKVSEYTKEELYGQPHNIIRHPDMPKSIFKYIWNSLLSKEPVVAYVKNYIKGNEKYYWVKAVMYPKVVNNEIATITSYRTKATKFEISQISEVYKSLLVYEQTHTVEESLEYFFNYLKEKSLTYDKMINRLNDNQQILNTTLLNLDINRFKIDHMIFRSRIESLVEKGYKDITVTNTSLCEFGKRLASFENENFAQDSKFAEIKYLHNEIHKELQEYTSAKPEEREYCMNKVYQDIDKLFVLMKKLKDEHKYDNVMHLIEKV